MDLHNGLTTWFGLGSLQRCFITWIPTTNVSHEWTSPKTRFQFRRSQKHGYFFAPTIETHTSQWITKTKTTPRPTTWIPFETPKDCHHFLELTLKSFSTLAFPMMKHMHNKNYRFRKAKKVPIDALFFNFASQVLSFSISH
jgi:hypothetical protein